jgi:ribonuclease HI
VIAVTTAEAQAVRDGLRLIERTGCNRVVVETDSMEVVKAFHDP